ncbi:MAG: APA family basic amino acid/polyamine antiporter [Acidimicrobiales bacterium]
MTNQHLARSLGFGQITASGVGIIIGAGIYVLLGAATAEAGAAVWVSFLIAGALSALTALSYAELAAMFPNAGAEYDYTRRVAPEWTAFVIGWVMILGLVIAAAAVALGFASYVRYFVDVPLRVAAWALIAVVTLIALAGIEQSAKLTVALSAFQVGGLVVIVAIGVPHLGDHDLLEGSTTAGVMTAAALVFFAFVGFDEVITLAEETTNPARTVPRALLVALALSTALYVAVAVAAVSVLGPSALGASDQPLADVMAEAIGSRSAKVVAVVAMIATTNTSLLALTAASRLQFGMADTGALPAVFRRLSVMRAPWVAIMCASLVAAAFVAVGDLKLVAGVTDFSVYLVFIAVNITVILLRFWQPNRLRPFFIRGAIGKVPVVPVVALAAIALLVPSLEVTALLIGAIVAIIGVAVFAALAYFRKRAAEPPNPVEKPLVPRTSVNRDEAAQVAAALRIDFASVSFDLDQFHRGMGVELQHGTGDPDTNITNDDLVATGKIALAHLNEIPDYYTRLAAMEAEARRQQ